MKDTFHLTGLPHFGGRVLESGRNGRLRLGIIGAGRIGRVHCQALSTNRRAQVVIVADYILKAAQACTRDFGVPLAVRDWKEVVNSSEVDAVVICSPSNTHAEIIEAAAAKRKHIFCEKPIDYDLGRIDRAIAAVAAAGVKLQLGFQRRFDKDFRRVREAVRDGQVGQPYMLSIVSRDPAPPPLEYIKQSGGLFFDMMIHDFDMARFVMGAEVVELTTTASSFDPEIEQLGDVTSAVVSMKFTNGAIGTIQCCRKAVYGYDQRIEVLGSKGSVEIGNRYPNTATLSTDMAVQRDLPLNFFMDRYADAYVAEMNEFVDAVLTGKPSPVRAQDGRVPVVLAYAAVKSLKERRAIRIAEITNGMSRL